MAGTSLDTVLSHLHRLAAARGLTPCPDAALLDRFVSQRDEAAFTALVERHGPMVLGVCRRVLRDPHDAEDACQAVFLILARKAGGVRRAGALGGWLHAVAFRVACRLRVTRARRRGAEHPLTDVAAAAEPTWREAQAILDEELQRLPEKWRAPLVLCYLEGKTRDEAARQLGWSVGTVRGRLARGRALLKLRLCRRGLSPSLPLAAALAPNGAASALCVATTVRAILDLSPAPQRPEILTLAEEVMRTMSLSRFTVATSILLAVFLSVGLGAMAYNGLAGERTQSRVARPGRVGEPIADKAAPAALLDTWVPLPFPNFARPDFFQTYQVVVTKNCITFLKGDNRREFTYKLDSTKVPAALDLTPVGGGNAIPAIYAQDGDYLQICFDGWQGNQRPRAFTHAKDYGGKTLLFLKRAQPRTATNETDKVRIHLAILGLALYHHVQEKGTFPPAAFHDKAGKPLLSWRVSLLPGLQQNNIYKLVNWDEPWDSENNQRFSSAGLVILMPVRELPGVEFGDTFYRTFVGPGTAFDTKKGRKLADVLAGGANPLLIVETAAATPWAQPGEFEYAPDGKLPKLGGVFEGGFHALFADGSVRFISSKLDEKALRQLIAPAPAGKKTGAQAPEAEPFSSLLEKAKRYRAQARERFGERQALAFPNDLRYRELAAVLPLLRPEMKKEHILELLGPPNQPDGSYHFGADVARLAFREDRLADDSADLFRRAGSHYGYVNKVRALQRLAETRPFEAAVPLLKGRNQDFQVWTARALGLLSDPRAVPVLIQAARDAAFLMEGSENATVHGVYHQTLASSLRQLTGLELKIQGGQDPQGLRGIADEAEAWWNRNKDKAPAAALELRLSLDKTTLAVGQAPRVNVEVKNVSAQPVAVCAHPALFRRYLTTRDGREVGRLADLESWDPKMPGKGDTVRLAPGEVRKVDLGRFDTVIEDGQGPTEWKSTPAASVPGEYRLRVNYCGVDVYGREALGPCWTGILTSDTVTIRYTAP